MKKKKHSAAAIKGLEKFAQEEGKEKYRKRKRGIKLTPVSKGHKPKGKHGMAAVKAIGRTKTTGNFKKIEKAKGKGAAIATYQNKLKAHKGKRRRSTNPFSQKSAQAPKGARNPFGKLNVTKQPQRMDSRITQGVNMSGQTLLQKAMGSLAGADQAVSGIRRRKR